MTNTKVTAEDKKAARDRLDRLFEVALVLIGVLAAAELQYITASQFPSGLETVQKVIWLFNLGLATVPFLLLIPAWMARELLMIRQKITWSLRMTFFCWGFWGILLFVYLVNLFGLLDFLPKTPILIISGAASLISVAIIAWLYKETASELETKLYFNKSTWKPEILLCVAVGFIIIALIILGLTFPNIVNLMSNPSG